jgi:hypothetical protein
VCALLQVGEAGLRQRLQDGVALRRTRQRTRQVSGKVQALGNVHLCCHVVIYSKQSVLCSVSGTSLSLVGISRVTESLDWSR